MTTWQNRIVGHEIVDADQLLANPSNWRIHPKGQQDALEGVLDAVGWVQEVIVNKNTQFVVDGHMRVTLAITRGEQVPVKYVDLTEDEEQLILATLDPISALAGTDAAQLDALLQSVNSDNAAIQQMLAGLASKAGLYPQDPYEMWQGMPEFENENLDSFRSILVHFKSQADVDVFSELVGQSITDKTKYIYYPKVEDVNLKPYRVIDES